MLECCVRYKHTLALQLLKVLLIFHLEGGGEGRERNRKEGRQRKGMKMQRRDRGKKKRRNVISVVFASDISVLVFSADKGLMSW